MGFYNIYRILKDMLRTLFGKRFLKITIIVILIFIIFFVYNECFALSTIPPITVDGVTFNFTDSRWSQDSASFHGNMDNVTIFRLNRTDGRYIYCFTRSSYPITIVIRKSGKYNVCETFSYNDTGNNSYYMYKKISVSKSTTSVDADTPNFGGGVYFDSQYDNFYTDSLTVLYSNKVVYYNNSPIYNPYKAPSLANTQEQLQNLSFSNFIINANSFTDEIENNDGTLFMLFYNRSLSNSQNTDGLYPIKEKGFAKGSIYTDCENSTSDNMIFSYPIFKSGVFFNVGSTYEIRFAKKVYNAEYSRDVYEYLGDPIQFTVSSDVTQDYINQLNQQTATSTDSETTQELQSSIDNQTTAIENQTQSIDNINNSITDSNVDNSSIDLPTDNTQDPTQSRRR